MFATRRHVAYLFVFLQLVRKLDDDDDNDE
jgi:hypothetical protein